MASVQKIKVDLLLKSQINLSLVIEISNCKVHVIHDDWKSLI